MNAEAAVRRVTDDKIARATGGDVKLRAERKLGRSAEALAPQRQAVFIRSGGSRLPGNAPCRSRLGKSHALVQ
jgi:hypothetical protein